MPYGKQYNNLNKISAIKMQAQNYECVIIKYILRDDKDLDLVAKYSSPKASLRRSHKSLLSRICKA